MNKRRAVAIALVAVAGALATRVFRTPSAARHWIVGQDRPATPRLDSPLVAIENIRNFRYDSAGTPIPAYYDTTFNLDSIESAWFILTRFSTRWRAPAHTFVSFGFTGGRFIAISVEARREVGESYSILKGLFNSYELMYVIGDERDLIGKRVMVDGDDTWVYPVHASKPAIREMFRSMLFRAQRLEDDPEFYNSLFNSCTSNLVRHVNAIAPGRIPAGVKVLLPGYTDEVASRLGLIDSATSLEAIRQRYLVNGRVRAAIGAPDFSARIRGT